MSDATAPNIPDPAGTDQQGEVVHEVRMPSSQPILLRALRWGLITTAVLLVICGAVGWLVSGSPGLVGGIIGAASAGVFLALTVGSIAFANRFIGSELFVGMFFGIVLGAWILKFIVFIVAALLLRGQPWLDPLMFFLSLIAGVIASLVVDVLAVTRSRVPYVSDANPTDSPSQN